MNNKRIAILFGGCSTEYGVSLQSAAAVLDHLDRSSWEPVPLGITREGRWLRYSGPTRSIREDSWHSGPDAVPAFLSPCRGVGGVCELRDGGLHTISIAAALPVLHGKHGEDGSVQGLLELAGIPVIGCDLRSSVLCMDKEIAHILARAAGVAVPRWITLREAADLAAREEDIASLGLPLFVKPARSGSSFGVSRVDRMAQLPGAVRRALEHDDKVLVEEAVAGVELGCAILGTHDLMLGELDQIELSGGFFDYHEKYHLTSSRIHMPAPLSAELSDRVRETAVRVYRALECRGFARVDLFLGVDGALYFNEVNTIPGFTAHSRFPNMLRGAGLSLEQVLSCLLAERVPVC